MIYSVSCFGMSIYSTVKAQSLGRCHRRYFGAPYVPPVPSGQVEARRDRLETDSPLVRAPLPGGIKSSPPMTLHCKFGGEPPGACAPMSPGPRERRIQRAFSYPR